MNRLQQALADRFTDPDEIADVANHGCSGGVSGFIYYKEVREFFFKYEDEIEEMLAEYDYSLKDLISSPGDTINTLINTMVWCVVELYCQKVMDDDTEND
jgi:hypothetical protein